MPAADLLREQRLKRTPSAYVVWVCQSLFYCFSFFLLSAQAGRQGAVFGSFFERLLKGDVHGSFEGAWAFALCLEAALALVFILAMRRTRVSKRNSAFAYALLLLALSTVLNGAYRNSAWALFAFCAVLSFSFALFWLSVNSANREFSILYGIFARKVSPSHFVIRNVVSALVSFAMAALMLRLIPSLFFSAASCLASIAISFAFLSANAFTSRRRTVLLTYDAICESDEGDPRLGPMKNGIYNMFVRWYNPHFVNEIVHAFVRIFYHYKVIGADNISYGHLPAVFVCNHGEELGPVCGTTFIPAPISPWVHVRMCEYELAFERIWSYTFGPIFRFSWIGKQITKVIAHVVVFLIRGTRPLKVYRDNPREIMGLFHKTKDCLLEGVSVLIFPEDPSKSQIKDEYQKGSTGALYSGFAHIGKIYSDQIGKNLCFYPVFVSKAKRTVFIGEPLLYDSKSGNPRDEKERLAKELQQRMNSMA